MARQIKSIRTFIGAKDFEVSRAFYKDLGFAEKVISEDLSLFTFNRSCFYLQNYYVKDWVDNTMMLLEIENVDLFWKYLQGLRLSETYEPIKLIPIKNHDWGRECLLVDPSGVLWHFVEYP